MMFDAFHDEEGMTTVGMVLSLLVTLALVFSAGQAYRVGSASSEVQNVADAAALAAQNEVGEFMIVVRVCDAAVLSLSLTSLVATGLGVAALCTPATASASETLLKAGRDVAYARDRFAEKAADGLDRLQRLLPFLAAFGCGAAASASVAGRARRRTASLVGEGDVGSSRVAWLLRNGVGWTRPVTRALLGNRAHRPRRQPRA